MRNVKKLLLITPLLLSLLSCGSTNNGINDNTIKPLSNSSKITISNTGIIPVVNAMQYKTVVYIHNNSDKVISGISYSANLDQDTQNSFVNIKNSISKLFSLFGLTNLKNEGEFIDSNSKNMCVTINPGQACPLLFTTPKLNNSLQTSAIITANYVDNKQSYQFSQLLNFVSVNSTKEEGVINKYGVSINSYGNKTGYGMIYIYGSGVNSMYTVDSMSIDNDAFKIVQGDITNRQMVSGFVQAIEVSAIGGLKNYITSNFTIKSTSIDNNHVNKVIESNNLQVNTYTSSSSLNAAPSNNGAVLVANQTMYLNTSNTSNASITVLNSGNMSTNIMPSAGNGITNLNGCSSSLAPGTSCTLTFSVTSISGSANITFNYSNGSPGALLPLTVGVVWYNSGGALLDISSSSNPASASNTTITVSNVGGYSMTNFSIIGINALGQSSASATVGDITCSAGGSSLPVGGNCSFVISFTDSVAEVSSFDLVVRGVYNNNIPITYDRHYIQVFNSSNFAANLHIDYQTLWLSTILNSSNVTPTITVTNTGLAPANITSSVLNSTSAQFIRSAGSCGVNNYTLNPGSSCTIVFTLLTNLVVNGNASYVLSYSGGTASNLTASSNLYFVVDNSQELTISNVALDGITSGTGIMSDPYILQNTNSNNQTITLTLTSTGANPVTIKGIADDNSTLYWSRSGTCTTGFNFADSSTCTLVYTNNTLANMYALPASASLQTNLFIPTITFTDNTNPSIQFIRRPLVGSTGITGNIIYAQNRQPVITTQTIDSTSPNIKISALISNYDAGIGTLRAQFEDYTTNPTNPNIANCNSSTSQLTNGVVTWSCDIANNGTSYATYVRNTNIPANVEIHAVFSIVSNERVAINSTYQTGLLP